jgi:hypothetical protein
MPSTKNVNRKNKRIVTFNCQLMTPSCIVNSFGGKNSSSDASTVPTTTTTNVDYSVGFTGYWHG